MKKFTLYIFLFLPFYLASQTKDTSTLLQELDSLISLNQNLIKQKKYDEAIQVIVSAKIRAEENLEANHPLYASCLFNYGKSLYYKRQFAEVVETLLKAKEVQKEILDEDDLNYAATLNILGVSYWNLGQFEEAEIHLKETVEIRERVLEKNNPSYLGSMVNLGMLYTAMGKYDDAKSLLTKAKEIFEINKGLMSHPYYLNCVGNLAQVYTDLGEYEKVENLYLYVINLIKDDPDKEIMYARVLNSLGLFYMKVGRYEDAEPVYKKAITLYEKTEIRNDLSLAGAIINLGSLYYFLGKYELSESVYLEGKEILEKANLNRHPYYMNCLNGLGTLYERIGRFKETEKIHFETKKLRKEVLGEKHVHYASTLANLGVFYFNIGNYEEAEKYMKDGNDVFKKAVGAEHPDYALSLLNLGNLYRRIDKQKEAELNYQMAKEIYAHAFGVENPDYALTLYNLAGLYADQGQLDTAETLYLEVKKIQEKILGDQHLSLAKTIAELGLLYQEMNRSDSAEQYCLSAKNIYEKAIGKENLSYLANLNNLFKLFIKTNRIESAQLVIAEISEIQHALLNRASLHLSETELDAYTRLFTKHLDQLLAFTRNHTELSPELYALCYDNILFHKGFLLTNASRLKRLALKDTTSAREFEKLKAFHRRLAVEYAKPFAERKNVNDLEAQANIVEKELVSLVAEFGNIREQVTWQEVRNELKSGEAAVEFIHFQHYNPEPTDTIYYAALVLKPKDQFPSFVPLCKERELLATLEPNQNKREKYINQLYRGIEPSSKIKDFKSTYKLIWEPLDSFLFDVQRIYCSSSGLLSLINHSAVPVKSLKSNEILGQQFEFFQMNSSRNIVTRTAGSFQKDDAVVMGGIEYGIDSLQLNKMNLSSEKEIADNSKLTFDYFTRNLRSGKIKYLEGTEREADEIGRHLLYSDFDTEIQKGYHATEEIFKNIGQTNPSPRILHIATHGFFFPDPVATARSGKSSFIDEPIFKVSDNPMIRSGLLLAGSQPAWSGEQIPSAQEDGILTAYEISQMDLSNTELVVLSACETGLGDIQGNEGVYGLQRAFKIAGAKYLIMSLWDVPDGETADFMTTFYKEWLGGKNIHSAFRETQRLMREDYSDEPYLWAGFVLVE